LDTGVGVAASLGSAVAALINDKLPAGSSVTVTLEAGPTGTASQDNATTQLLTIASAKGDVRIDAASTQDLAALLMLGAANGGVEVSRYASARPAPTGYVFSQAEAAAFAALMQNSFNKIRVDGVEIDLSVAPYKLATTGVGVTDPRLYQDATATNQSDGRDGVREKLNILASAINAKRAADSTFGYAAEVWGNRLALLPLSGSDNQRPVVERLVGAVVTAPPFKVTAQVNTRYYMLNAAGTAAFQTAGAGGLSGGMPQASDYEAAYTIIDREVDLFNLLILPKDSAQGESDIRKLWGPASVFCNRRRAFLLMDPPDSWTNVQKATDASVGVNSLRVGLVKDHAAVFYPNLKLNENGKEVQVGPCGAIAGLFARIDSARGVWKAPAGTEADLRGITGVQYKFSDGENGVLNPAAINTLRVFPNGLVSWGSRTMDGDDNFGSEYKYIPIRRLALYMEESLYRGLKWVVFEPNDEPLWAQIRLNVGAFMHDLFRQGAFQGATPKDAYFVKCDASTTTQNDRNLGLVNVVVGFAPLKPAEFVVLYLQQMAGQIQV
jgi:phage tail sheath protein FI